MFGDDEQGDGELHGDEEGRPLAAYQHPGKEGEAGRAQNGRQRDIAGEQQNQGKDGNGGQRGGGRGHQEDSEAGGHALAPFEVKPDRKDMTEDRRKSGQRLHVAKLRIGLEEGAD